MSATSPPRANERIPLSAEPRGRPRFGGLLRRLVRPTSGLVLPLAGKRWNPLFAVVEHRGRRSARPYATPVGARRTEIGFVVSLAFGAHVDWHRNLAAVGGGAVRWRGISYPVGAPLPVDPETALATFNVVQRIGLRLGRIDGFVLVPDAGEPAG